MYLTSESIRKNPQPGVRLNDKHRISIDDTFLALDLFAEVPHRAIIHQSPSTNCRNCAAFLCPQATTVPEKDMDSGRHWKCALCQTKNDFDYDIRSSPEYQANVYDLIVPNMHAGYATMQKSSQKSSLSIILCDSKLLCDDEDLFSFLQQSLQASTDETMDTEEVDQQLVAIVFFDKVVRVPRLASLVQTDRPVEIDVFDNNSPLFRSATHAILQQGLHVTSKRLLQTCLHRLSEVVHTVKMSVVISKNATSSVSRFSLSQHKLFSNASTNSSTTATSPVDGALAFAKNTALLLSQSLESVSVTLLTGRSLYFSQPAPTTTLLKQLLQHFYPIQSAAEESKNSGKFTLNLLQIGARLLTVPQILKNIISETGGSHITSEHVTDRHLLQDTHRLLSLFHHQRAAIINNAQKRAKLKVWCSHGAHIASVTGPVQKLKPAFSKNAKNPNTSSSNDFRSSHTYHSKDYEVTIPNVDDVFVHVQLQATDSDYHQSNGTKESTNKVHDDSNNSRGNASWVQRAMKYLHTQTQSHHNSVTDLPQHTNTSTINHANIADSSSSNNNNAFNHSSIHTMHNTAEEKEETAAVTIMVALYLPHCDYQRLLHWKQQHKNNSNATKDNDKNGDRHTVIRVWTLTLPLVSVGSTSLWSQRKLSVPLTLMSIKKNIDDNITNNNITNNNSSSTTINNASTNNSVSVTVNLSSGDLWVWAVAHLLVKFYHTRLSVTTSATDTVFNSNNSSKNNDKNKAENALNQHMKEILDALSVGLMQRLSVTLSTHHHYHSSTSAHNSHNNNNNYYSNTTTNEAVLSLYEALWCLYFLKHGPMFTNNALIAAEESALLREAFVSSKLSVLQRAGLMRPRLWVLWDNMANTSNTNNNDCTNYTNHNSSNPNNSSNHSLLLVAVEVLAESTQLLSLETAQCIVYFTGDRVVVSRSHDTSDCNDTTTINHNNHNNSNNMNHHSSLMAQFVTDTLILTHATLNKHNATTTSMVNSSSSRIPQPSSSVRVSVLPTAGSPQDRWLFSRLSPRHMDLMHNNYTVTNNNHNNSNNNSNNSSSNYSAQSLVNNGEWSKSNMQEVVDSVINVKRFLLQRTNNNTNSRNDNTNNDDNSDLEISISNIRRDLETYFPSYSNTNNSITNENGNTHNNRFHIRRNLPYIEEPFSFQRYVLSLAEISVINANSTNNNAHNSDNLQVQKVTTMTHWKRLLLEYETLFLHTHNTTNNDNANHIHSTNDINASTSYNGNNIINFTSSTTTNKAITNGGKNSSIASTTMRSERMAVSDRGIDIAAADILNNNV